MSHYGLLANIFGGGLYCVEIRQLICKASWLAGFYMVWDFAAGIFEQTITVLISVATIAKCLFVFITAAMSFWWFFRLLACGLLKSSFVDVFIVCFLHLFYGSVLRWFLPLNVFLITNYFISSRYFSLTVCFFLVLLI